LSALAALSILLATSTPLPAADGAPPSPQARPNVLIIGDSISIGYTPYVKQLLKAEAAVARNPGNAQDTGTGLTRLDAWLGTNQWAVIHFNWGLHDLCYRNPQSPTNAGRDKVNGKLTTSLEQYEKNLELLVQRLAKTGAILIWASTTTVPDGEDGRFAGDEKKYNEVAARVMQKHGILTDDLQALTAGFGPELFLGPGDVHYQPEGYRTLAAQVAAQVRAALPDSPAHASATPK
jgi:lysophospholipase L1-like esterase